MQQLKVIPYSPSYLTSSFERVIVLPIEKAIGQNDSGLLLPSDIGRICDKGIVFAAGASSSIKQGDEVLYAKLDRSSEEHVDVISYNDEMYDALYENEIWAVNGHPMNRLFVEPISEFQVSEQGLMVPATARGITQKGKVFRAPSHYSVAAGDNVEYRRPEQGIFPIIEIDGKIYDVLNESEIFLVNGKVAPYRIIVKIDKIAQNAKRETTEGGLIRSQLFLFMKHNLQYAEVTEIGEEAQKLYPDLKVGDTAIMHHTVEDHTGDYRLIRKDVSKFQICTYEYRVINAFDTSGRELIGRIVNRDKMILSSYGKNIFLEWKFEVMEKSTVSESLLVDFQSSLDKCTDIEDLVDTINKNRQEYISKAKAKMQGKLKVLSQADPRVDKDKFDRMETEYKEAQADALKVANKVNANHLLICRRLDNRERVVIPYRELYPIEILGRKYLVGWRDYMLATAEIDLVAEVANSD